MRASVLDPMSGEGATEILDARAFLREVGLAALLALPLVFHASLRLNAATLARERALAGATPLRVYPAMKGPRMLRSFVAGSVRSRSLAGFPGMFGIIGAVGAFNCVISGGALDISLFMLLPGVMLVRHAIIVARLVV